MIDQVKLWRSLDPTNTPNLSFSEPFNQQQFQDNKPAPASTIGTTTNY
ncbi:hypothetical protein [Helicobacter pylori]|nr:hypothetical protein [Helicobacter pylori]